MGEAILAFPPSFWIWYEDDHGLFLFTSGEVEVGWPGPHSPNSKEEFGRDHSGLPIFLLEFV